MKPVTPQDQPEKRSETLEALINNPGGKVYAAVSAGALLVLVVSLFLFGSPIGAAVVLVTGLTGLVLRWMAMPVFTVFAVAYVSYAPLGFPQIGGFSMIPGSYFRVADLIVVTTLVIYLFGTLRFYTLAQQGMPLEIAKHLNRKKVKPPVRPPEPIGDPELIRFFLRVGAVVVLGQLLWLAVTKLGLDFRQIIPINLDSPDQVFRFRGPDGEGGPLISSGLHRFLLSVGFFVTLAFILRFIFWYWRLATLNPDQAELILKDTQWSESRRELNRQQKWRAYAKAKALGLLPTREKGGCLFTVMLILLFIVAGLMFSCCLAVFNIR